MCVSSITTRSLSVWSAARRPQERQASLRALLLLLIVWPQDSKRRETNTAPWTWPHITYTRSVEHTSCAKRDSSGFWSWSCNVSPISIPGRFVSWVVVDDRETTPPHKSRPRLSRGFADVHHHHHVNRARSIELRPFGSAMCMSGVIFIPAILRLLFLAYAHSKGVNAELCVIVCTSRPHQQTLAARSLGIINHLAANYRTRARVPFPKHTAQLARYIVYGKSIIIASVRAAYMIIPQLAWCKGTIRPFLVRMATKCVFLYNLINSYCLIGRCIWCTWLPPSSLYLGDNRTTTSECSRMSCCIS